MRIRLISPDRDVNAHLLQLFQQQRLGHVLVVVLVEDVTDQIRSEMAAGQNIGGERSHHVVPIGGQPVFAAVADDARLEFQILNDKVFVSLKTGPGGTSRQQDERFPG